MKEIDLSPLKNECVIAVNDAYILGDWPVVFFGDYGWQLIHWTKQVKREDRDHPGLMKHKNLIVTNCPKIVAHYSKYPRFHVVRRRLRGLQRQGMYLPWYYNSGACAAALAVLMGCKRVCLVAFDMYNDSKIPTRHNWHNNLKDKGITVGQRNNHLQGFEMLKKDMKGTQYEQIEIFNTNPKSKLETFTKITFKESLKWTGSE